MRQVKVITLGQFQSVQESELKFDLNGHTCMINLLVEQSKIKDISLMITE